MRPKTLIPKNLFSKYSTVQFTYTIKQIFHNEMTLNYLPEISNKHLKKTPSTWTEVYTLHKLYIFLCSYLLLEYMITLERIDYAVKRRQQGTIQIVQEGLKDVLGTSSVEIWR